MTEETIKIINELLGIGRTVIDDVVKSGGFLFVHRAEAVFLNNSAGVLIWDYGVWNEITFVDSKTGRQQKLFSGINDKEAEEMFNKIVIETKAMIARINQEKQRDMFSERIMRLKELLDNEAITKEEYERIKKDLMKDF